MKSPTEIQYFTAWVLFFLVATLGGLAGMIVGGSVYAEVGDAGMKTAEVPRFIQITSFVIGIGISYITFRAVVGKYLFRKGKNDSTPKT